MRILLDQNLSPKLIRKLADIIPGLETVYDQNLVGASDPFIFDWARGAEFTAVVSTDLVRQVTNSELHRCGALENGCSFCMTVGLATSQTQSFYTTEMTFQIREHQRPRRFLLNSVLYRVYSVRA